MTFEGSAFATSVGSTGRYSLNPTPTASSYAGTYKASRRDFLASFYAVLQRWRSETSFLSDPLRITSNPSFKAMVANADLCTPLIIEELRKTPSLLVWVLDEAFGDQPYSDSEAGNIEKMTEGWIAWAEQNGRTV